MKYLKLFEAWVEEPIFLRRSHYDLLNGESEGEYQPAQRVRMIGSPVINQSLVSRGFPDKENCIHFMDRVAYDSFGTSMTALWGDNLYEVKIDDSSKIAWTFLLNINDWYYKSNPYKNNRNHVVIQDLEKLGYDEIVAPLDNNFKIKPNKIKIVDKMTDLLISSGAIGTGTIQDLKSTKYFKDGIRFFAWTNHKVYLKKI
jgi:hypothetical protein